MRGSGANGRTHQPNSQFGGRGDRHQPGQAPACPGMPPTLKEVAC